MCFGCIWHQMLDLAHRKLIFFARCNRYSRFAIAISERPTPEQNVTRGPSDDCDTMYINFQYSGHRGGSISGRPLSSSIPIVGAMTLTSLLLREREALTRKHSRRTVVDGEKNGTLSKIETSIQKRGWQYTWQCKCVCLTPHEEMCVL